MDDQNFPILLSIQDRDVVSALQGSRRVHNQELGC